MKSRGFLPALPALILLFVFFLFPVVRMLGFSLEGGTLDWYAKALGEQLYLRVFWNTFEIALLVTFFCLLLGYPLGFLMATTTPFWATVGSVLGSEVLPQPAKARLSAERRTRALNFVNVVMQGLTTGSVGGSAEPNDCSAGRGHSGPARVVGPRRSGAGALLKDDQMLPR